MGDPPASPYKSAVTVWTVSNKQPGCRACEAGESKPLSSYFFLKCTKDPPQQQIAIAQQPRACVQPAVCFAVWAPRVRAPSSAVLVPEQTLAASMEPHLGHKKPNPAPTEVGAGPSLSAASPFPLPG